MGGNSANQDGGTSGGSSGDDQGTGGSASEDFTGVYSAGKGELDCAVSTQLFVTDEFSIVCQNDDDGFVQITFKDEASARTAGSFTITERNYFEHPEPTTVDVSYDSFGDEPQLVSQSDLPGTVEVTASGGHNVLTLTDVELHSFPEAVTGTVSATIDF